MEPFCVKRFIIIIIIEIGLESTQRSCPHCHLHVETEIHHLLDCPFYNDLRKIMLAYIIDLGREDRLKFLIDICKVCLFIYCFKRESNCVIRLFQCIMFCYKLNFLFRITYSLTVFYFYNIFTFPRVKGCVPV